MKFSTLFVLTLGLLIVFTLDEANCQYPNYFKSPVVKLEQGKAQGLKLISRKERNYYGFLGVPFGKVSERFSVSDPPDSWEGVKQFNQLAQPCFQYNVFVKQNIGIEDCLQMNIYSPKVQLNAKLPVLVWLYPGGFQIGGASMCEAKYLMDEDVVFVSINYRLGAMGFLDTTDGVVSGNMGLKDQVQALKWVKINIEKFGGDPNLVTLIGMSAGGASVNYHLISSMSRGLFQRAISLSGSALNPYALQSKPKDLFKSLAKNADCVKTNTKEIVECLRSKTPEELIEAQLKISKFSEEFDLISMKFVPTIESELSTATFLSEHPYNLIKEGKIVNKVPYWTGYVENEGSFYTALLSIKPESIAKLDNEWYKMAPNMFYYEDVTSSDSAYTVSREILKFYFGENDITLQNRRILSDIYTDRFFANGIIQGALLHAKYQPVFTYFMNYQGKYSGIQFDFQGIKNRDGFAHADELIYLFNQTLGYPEIELGTEDGDFSEKYIKLLVSFARDGKPTETWGPQKEWHQISPSDEKKLKLYQIDLKNTRLIPDPYKARRAAWEKLPLNENHKFGKVGSSKDEL